MKYNQKFVDIVRASSSEKNKNRYLTVNTYGNISEYAYDEAVKKYHNLIYLMTLQTIRFYIMGMPTILIISVIIITITANTRIHGVQIV